MDELLASGIKLDYIPGHSFVFEIGDETEASKLRNFLANCPSIEVCEEWAKCQKNKSMLLDDTTAEIFRHMVIFLARILNHYFAVYMTD